MTAEHGVFLAFLTGMVLWAVYLLGSALYEVWHRHHVRSRWHEHTEGDYLDLRPRIEIGRRRWR